MAITGSSLAATAAGTMPATNPMTEETPSPKIILGNDNTTCKLPNGAKVSNQTNRRPDKPPIKLNKTDSNKN